MRTALLHSLLRPEEKLLIEAAGRMSLDMTLVDVDSVDLADLHAFDGFDLVLNRVMSADRALYAARVLEEAGIPNINGPDLIALCQDKYLTSLRLKAAGVPVPAFGLAFGLKQAEDFIAAVGGYPVVAKPCIGSWGRLISRINDRDALEAVLEHRQYMGSSRMKALYLQEYIAKPGRDIRVFCFGGRARCAIYRYAEHWITNTARGARTENCPVTPELERLSSQAAGAMGEGVLALDIFETGRGLLVNEINHTMEFRNSEAVTGVSISSAILEYALGRAGEARQAERKG